MTGPSSYLFNLKDKTPQVEGDELARIVVDDDKVTFSIEQVVKRKTSELLHHKTLLQQTFSLHKNRDGKKYIKKTEKNPAKLSFSRLKGFLSLPSYLPKECISLMEDAVLNWFEGDYTSLNRPPHLLYLSFPVFRDSKLPSSFPTNSGMTQILDRVPRPSVITKALQENSSWRAFIDDICDPNVIKVQKDLDVLEQHPKELIPLAMMNLCQTMSSLYAQHNLLMLEVNYAFMPTDLKFLAFMFKYLPAVNRGEATRLLFDVLRTYDELAVTSDRDNPIRTAHLNRVPSRLRSSLAQELLNSLKDTHAGLQKNPEEYITETTIDTRFGDVFNSWFYSNVFEPERAGCKITMISLEARFFELFGTPLRKSTRENNSSLRFFYKDGCAAFGAISEKGYVHGPTDDIFTHLDKLVVTQRPQDRGSGCDAISDEGYVDAYNDLNWIFGKVYLLDDINEIIEKGAGFVDSCLIRLGRELTPENRVFFLTLGRKERELKSTWKYYDWGVTDPKRILALKRGKISKKSDVQTYNELPDEMFYELVALESGDNSTIILFVDEFELLTQLK